MAQTPAGGGDAAGDGLARGTGRAFDLREFRPILAQERLAGIRTAIDEQRHADAAQGLAEWMERENPQGIERARFAYLLASQQRLAGDLAGAASSLLPAVETPWVLEDDARLLLGQIYLESARPADALDAVAEVSDEFDSPRLLEVRARALSELGKHGDALGHWAELERRGGDAFARLGLAESLFALAGQTSDAMERQLLLGRAYRSARSVRYSAGGQSDLPERAGALIAQAVLGGVATTEEEPRALIEQLEQLCERWDYDRAAELLAEVQLRDGESDKVDWCRLQLVRAKILAGKREWGKGADLLRPVVDMCRADADLHAKILFNAGKFSAADGRHTTAVDYYGRLETEHPTSSLADDSRLRAAQSYLRAGVVARFTELLLALPEDYPDGDMTMEGVLTLALYRIERSDWAGALVVLERGAKVVRATDSARGHEESGRERYFWARALGELSQEEEALLEYEAIVRELPLSYYMLHAYSRLHRLDPARAKKALEQGVSRARTEPFSFPHRPEYDTLPFRRGMELLRIGELSHGRQVLSRAGLESGADASLLWGLALLYDEAGDAHVSHRIARGKLTDWFAHYPAGDWLRPWQIGFPRPYQEIVSRESKKNGVPEWFIYGVMREESTFDPQVVSHADAYGLMQLIMPTARAFAKQVGLSVTPATLKMPAINIALGSRVLRSLTDRFSDNPWLAIPGYNAGPGRPQRWMRERSDVDFDVWVELIPFRETRRYTKRVLASRAAYAYVYYPDEAEGALLLPERLGK